MKKGSKVLYLGCDDDQANWGQGLDPREYLTIGKIYTLKDDPEIHSWHTLYFLEDIEDNHLIMKYGIEKGFNSVCFEKFTLEEHEEKISFRKQLEVLINKNSKENGSDTPDFMLAEFLESCLDNFDKITKQRDAWKSTSELKRIKCLKYK